MSARLSTIRRQRFEANPCCAYCGKAFDRLGQAVLDHVQPRCKGGSDGRYNLALACRECDRRKAGLTPQELMAWAYAIWSAAHAR